VSLSKYLALQKDLENYKDNENALKAALYHHICDIDTRLMSKLDAETMKNIDNDLNSFMNQNHHELKPKIMIGNTEYGFEPDLSRMSYGAYLDISSYETFTIDENWSKIMDILYRPIKKKQGGLYEIEEYKVRKEDSDKKWLNVGMDIHFGVFFYFIALLTDLQKGIVNSLTKQKNLPTHIKRLLEESGKVMRVLPTWQMKI
jgi:hypothetical protein